MTYSLVSNFKDGDRAWGDRDYVIERVGYSPCEGELFLRPSKHKSIPQGTSIGITVYAYSSSSNVKLCVFTVPDVPYRNGGWFTSLYGFTLTDTKFFHWYTSLGPSQKWGTLCKQMDSSDFLLSEDDVSSV